MSPLLNLDEEPETPSISAERTRRMARALREVKPTRAEVRAAHARFLARRAKKRTVRVVPLALGFVSLLVSAFAFAAGVRFVATHDVMHALVPSLVSSLAPSSPATKPTHGRAAHARSTPPAAAAAEPTPPPVNDEDTSSAPPPAAPGPAPAPAAVPVPLPSSPPPVPPPVPPPATSTPEAHVAVPSPRDVAPPLSPPAAVSLSSTPIRRASSVAPSLPSSATVPETSPWVVAAKAMRSGDYATAERAFEQLATSSDPQPRDEARLARAQVWLAEGRVSEARPELSTLAATGATSLVRQRAADALRKIDDSSKP